VVLPVVVLSAAVLVLLVVVAVLARRLRAAGANGARAAALAQARAAELAHLAVVRAPAIAEHARDGHTPHDAGPLAPDAVGDDFARHLATVTEYLAAPGAVRRERALRDSVQSAFESVARTMHAMATVQQQVLDRIEHTLHDPDVMADVMKADHAAAQMTRKAQTLLVMCGIWPGRRETRPVSLYDCVRGAQSRIVEFGRIEPHGGQGQHVVPRAAEGLMHTLAELLENAAVFSPSSSPVVVKVREVGAGAVVEIDDAGLGMPPDVLEQAVAQLSGGVDLARLGAVPRLGLACVGRWARELGFRVELSGASAYGGTRAVVFVPNALLTEPVAAPGTPRSAYDGLPRTTFSGPTRAARSQAPGDAPDAPVPAVPATAPDSDTVRLTLPAADGPPAGRPAADGTAAARVPAQAAPPGQAPGGLPRRRSRRAAPDARPAAPAAPAPAPGAGTAGRTEDPVEERAPWTPQDARASVTSVLSGVRRGRAAGQSGRPGSPGTGENAAPEEGRR
jgi:signal transduction histidine kinase